MSSFKFRPILILVFFVDLDLRHDRTLGTAPSTKIVRLHQPSGYRLANSLSRGLSC